MQMPPAKDLGNREEVPCHCAKANKVENKGRGGDSTGFWCNSVACCGRTSGEKCERRCRRRRAERRRQEDAEDNGSSRRPKPSLRRSAAANTGNWIKAGSRRGVGLEHLRDVVDAATHHVKVMRTAKQAELSEAGSEGGTRGCGLSFSSKVWSLSSTPTSRAISSLTLAPLFHNHGLGVVPPPLGMCRDAFTKGFPGLLPSRGRELRDKTGWFVHIRDRHVPLSLSLSLFFFIGEPLCCLRKESKHARLCI